MSQVIDAGIDSNSRVFFIKGERAAIVDTGAPDNERKILKALRKAGIPQGNVSILIVTHAHWDHCGSLHALKSTLNVPVMAGWPDAEYLEKGENTPVSRSAAKHATHLNFKGVRADVVVRGEVSLEAYGIDARVFRTPGHTDGSVSVLASDGNCTTGDFLARLYTAEPGVIKQSLKRMIDSGAKYFYPSHGPCVSAGDIFSLDIFTGQG